jgi:hypothetical protein
MADFTYAGTGNFYVHKQGSDTSYPTTTSQAIDATTLAGQGSQCVDKTLANFVPKATLQGALNVVRSGAYTVLVKSGFYVQAINASVPAIIKHEGIVVYAGNGTNAFTLNANGCSVERGVFVNYTSVFIQGGSGGITMTGCRVLNCPVNLGASVAVRGVFVGCAITVATGASNGIMDSTLYNCTNTGYINQFSSNDVGSGCTLYLNAANTPQGCNIRGLIGFSVAGNNSLDGTSKQGVALTLAQAKQEYPAISSNNFSADPQFNSAPRLDFTYQASSPNIAKSLYTAGGNIGGQPFVRMMYPTDQYDNTAQLNPLYPANGATYTNLTQQGNDTLIAAGQSEGTILTPPVFIGNTATVLGRVFYVGQLLFDILAAAGSANNNNSPRASINGVLTATAAYQMRWTFNSDKPTKDADYDNGNMKAAGAWGTFLFEEYPKIDATGKTSAEPGFNSATQGDVGACWVQFLFRQTNNNPA